MKTTTKALVSGCAASDPEAERSEAQGDDTEEAKKDEAAWGSPGECNPNRPDTTRCFRHYGLWSVTTCQLRYGKWRWGRDTCNQFRGCTGPNYGNPAFCLD